MPKLWEQPVESLFEVFKRQAQKALLKYCNLDMTRPQEAEQALIELIAFCEDDLLDEYSASPISYDNLKTWFRLTDRQQLYLMRKVIEREQVTFDIDTKRDVAGVLGWLIVECLDEAGLL